MFKSVFFDDVFKDMSDVFKDMDDAFKDIDSPDSTNTNTYTLKLTPNKEKGYNINYKADDVYGKLDITAEGSNMNECINNLIDNLKAETVKKEDESVDKKLLSLEKQNQKLKETNKDLCKTIEKLLAEKNKLEAENDELEAENIELQDMNDDLVISLNQITSAVDRVNTWFSEV